MHKIGVIGDSIDVLGFLTIGFHVFPVESAEEARKTILRLANENYAILYITENYAMECENTIARYKDTPLPAVITIPGKDGAKGYGLSNIRRSVERAVGTNILFKEE